MPGKNRTEEKKKQKLVEDLTFGMKNKNKSKKVQQQINELESRVMNKNKKSRQELDEAEQKKLAKLAQKQREKELKELFKPIPTKEELEKEQREKEEKERLEKEKAEAEAAGLVEGAEPKKPKSEEQQEEEALALLASVEDEIIEEEDMTLEEIIDKERSKIGQGTPVTWESFQKWKQFKMDQERKEQERLQQLEEETYRIKKSGVSGRLMFELDKDIFVDDEAAEEKIEKQEDADIDEDLFAEDDEEKEATTESSSGYDPEKWTDPKPPKQILQEMLQKEKKPLPVYEVVNQGGGEGFFIKLKLAEIAQEFFTTKVWPKKVHAENEVALLAVRYLEKNQQNGEASN